MIDELLVFFVVTVIILLGYAGNLFFERTRIPSFLFLIAMGVVIGPVLGIVDREAFIPLLGVFSTFTLIMVTFYSGLNLNLRDIILQSGRTLLQSTLYIVTSMILIATAGHLIMGWDLLQSLIFGSMTGGEITAAVVVPLTFSLNLSEDVKSILTLESAISTVYSIVLFFVLLQQWQLGTTDLGSALSSIIVRFSVGIVFGLGLSLLFLRMLHRLRGKPYTYVLTIAMTLLVYTLIEWLNGNGAFGVLMLGLFLSNEKSISRHIGVDMNIDGVFPSLNDFQNEISFLLETFFFVFLGLIFVVDPSSVLENMLAGLLFVVILVTIRFLAVTVAQHGSTAAKDRSMITIMCAQGIVPASLSIYLLGFNVPLKETFVSVITYIIILTNLVTTLGVWWSSRHRRSKRRGLLEKLMREVKKH